jgi:hypothetical protein
LAGKIARGAGFGLTGDLIIGEPQVGSSRKLRDKPTKRRRRSVNAISPARAIRRDGFAFGQWVQDNFKRHEFVRWLQPADTCDVAAPERGPVALTDVARVSTNLIRGGYLIRQSTLGKAMTRDDKKTSPAPKNGGVEKKAVAAKKDEGQPKDKTTPDADRSKAESGEKGAGSPTSYSRGEGQKPVSKAYRDNWNIIFGNKKKKKR